MSLHSIIGGCCVAQAAEPCQSCSAGKFNKMDTSMSEPLGCLGDRKRLPEGVFATVGDIHGGAAMASQHSRGRHEPRPVSYALSSVKDRPLSLYDLSQASGLPGSPIVHVGVPARDPLPFHLDAEHPLDVATPQKLGEAGSEGATAGAPWLRRSSLGFDRSPAVAGEPSSLVPPEGPADSQPGWQRSQRNSRLPGAASDPAFSAGTAGSAASSDYSQRSGSPPPGGSSGGRGGDSGGDGAMARRAPDNELRRHNRRAAHLRSKRRSRLRASLQAEARPERGDEGDEERDVAASGSSAPASPGRGAGGGTAYPLPASLQRGAARAARMDLDEGSAAAAAAGALDRGGRYDGHDDDSAGEGGEDGEEEDDGDDSSSLGLLSLPSPAPPLLRMRPLPPLSPDGHLGPAAGAAGRLGFASPRRHGEEDPQAGHASGVHAAGSSQAGPAGSSVDPSRLFRGALLASYASDPDAPFSGGRGSKSVSACNSRSCSDPSATFAASSCGGGLGSPSAEGRLRPHAAAAEDAPSGLHLSGGAQHHARLTAAALASSSGAEGVSSAAGHAPAPAPAATAAPPRQRRSLLSTRHFASDFTVLRQLGQGAFSSVCEAVDRSDGLRYAVKRSTEKVRSRRALERQLREFDAFTAVGPHPHLATYSRAWLESSLLYYQLELCEGGTVRHLQRSLPAGCVLPEGSVWAFIAHVAAALAHMHAQGWLHLDVKPENAMVACEHAQGAAAAAAASSCAAAAGSAGAAGQRAPERVVIKLGDLGMAVAAHTHPHAHPLSHSGAAGAATSALVSPSAACTCGHPGAAAAPAGPCPRCSSLDESRGSGGSSGEEAEDAEGDSRYMALELLSAGGRQPAADVFSLGLSAFELAWDLEPPTEGQPWHDVREGRLPPADPALQRSPEVLALIAAMLHPDPAARPSAQQVLQHPCAAAALAGSDPFLAAYAAHGFMVPDAAALGALIAADRQTYAGLCGVLAQPPPAATGPAGPHAALATGEGEAEAARAGAGAAAGLSAAPPAGTAAAAAPAAAAALPPAADGFLRREAAMAREEAAAATLPARAMHLGRSQSYTCDMLHSEIDTAALARLRPSPASSPTGFAGPADGCAGFVPPPPPPPLGARAGPMRPLSRQGSGGSSGPRYSAGFAPSAAAALVRQRSGSGLAGLAPLHTIAEAPSGHPSEHDASFDESHHSHSHPHQHSGLGGSGVGAAAPGSAGLRIRQPPAPVRRPRGGAFAEVQGIGEGGGEGVAAPSAPLHRRRPRSHRLASSAELDEAACGLGGDEGEEEDEDDAAERQGSGGCSGGAPQGPRRAAKVPRLLPLDSPAVGSAEATPAYSPALELFEGAGLTPFLGIGAEACGAAVPARAGAALLAGAAAALRPSAALQALGAPPRARAAAAPPSGAASGQSQRAPSPPPSGPLMRRSSSAQMAGFLRRGRCSSLGLDGDGDGEGGGVGAAGCEVEMPVEAEGTLGGTRAAHATYARFRSRARSFRLGSFSRSSAPSSTSGQLSSPPLSRAASGEAAYAFGGAAAAAVPAAAVDEDGVELWEEEEEEEVAEGAHGQLRAGEGGGAGAAASANSSSSGYGSVVYHPSPAHTGSASGAASEAALSAASNSAVARAGSPAGIDPNLLGGWRGQGSAPPSPILSGAPRKRSRAEGSACSSSSSFSAEEHEGGGPGRKAAVEGGELPCPANPSPRKRAHAAPPSVASSAPADALAAPAAAVAPSLFPPSSAAAISAAPSPLASASRCPGSGGARQLAFASPPQPAAAAHRQPSHESESGCSASCSTASSSSSALEANFAAAASCLSSPQRPHRYHLRTPQQQQRQPHTCHAAVSGGGGRGSGRSNGGGSARPRAPASAAATPGTPAGAAAGASGHLGRDAPRPHPAPRQRSGLPRVASLRRSPLLSPSSASSPPESDGRWRSQLQRAVPLLPAPAAVGPFGGSGFSSGLNSAAGAPVSPLPQAAAPRRRAPLAGVGDPSRSAAFPQSPPLQRPSGAAAAGPLRWPAFAAGPAGSAAASPASASDRGGAGEGGLFCLRTLARAMPGSTPLKPEGEGEADSPAPQGQAWLGSQPPFPAGRPAAGGTGLPAGFSSGSPASAPLLHGARGAAAGAGAGRGARFLPAVASASFAPAAAAGVAPSASQRLRLTGAAAALALQPQQAEAASLSPVPAADASSQKAQQQAQEQLSAAWMRKLRHVRSDSLETEHVLALTQALCGPGAAAEAGRRGAGAAGPAGAADAVSPGGASEGDENGGVGAAAAHAGTAAGVARPPFPAHPSYAFSCVGAPAANSSSSSSGSLFSSSRPLPTLLSGSSSASSTHASCHSEAAAPAPHLPAAAAAYGGVLAPRALRSNALLPAAASASNAAPAPAGFSPAGPVAASAVVTGAGAGAREAAASVHPMGVSAAQALVAGRGKSARRRLSNH